MRVLIDSLVHQASPSLVADLRDHGARRSPTETGAEIAVEIFDYFLPPTAIIGVVRRFAPDLLIVDREWIAIAALLRTLLEHDVKISAPRALLVVDHIDELAIIEAAHHGFFDLVDVSRDPSDIIDQLQIACQGLSTMRHDPLWTTHAPVHDVDISTVPLDEIDRQIMRLISIGLADKEIASAIHVSGQTVRNRVSAMLQRSGLTNRTQVAWMYTQSLLIARLMNHITLMMDQ